MSSQEPPLGKDLSGVRVPSPWPVEAGSVPGPTPAPEGPAEESDLVRLNREVRQLRAALEDIVAFALASADYKERAITMHRRAVAALTRSTLPRTGEPPS